MCGICGYYYKKEGSKRTDLLTEMGKKIIHRGPDDVGYYETSRVGLCHRRLSILDLTEKGHQPMKVGEELVLTYNGEIYNYIELREELTKLGYAFYTDTDTEVLLNGYREWGIDCLTKFNGMWSFALWDDKRKFLFCARDRFGVKPFYYHLNSERFIFASEIKALLCDGSIERIANDAIVYDYLTQGLLEHTNETFYKNIYKLPAGNFLIVKSDLSLEIKQYYTLKFSNNLNYKITESEKRKFEELFKNSVDLRLRADVEVGSCLSGGLDSSAIVCYMNQLLKEKGKKGQQHTFSFCTDDKRVDERKYMEEVIKETGVNGHPIFLDEKKLKEDLESLIYYQDEPFSSTGMYASYSVYRLAKENGITVLLDGQGADEILCGYRKSRIYYIQRLLKSRKYFRAVRELLGSISQIRGSIFIRNDLFKAMRILNKNSVSVQYEFLNEDFKKKEKGFDYSRKLDFQYNDIYVVSLPALLRYADRNSMAFSVESRLPFLDYRFVEFCADISVGKKIYNGWSKYIMRESLKIPELIKRRKDKIGFATPEDIWMKKEKDYFKSIFQSNQIASARFVNRERLMQNWDDIIEKRNASGLFRYICLELWMRKFEVS